MFCVAKGAKVSQLLGIYVSADKTFMSQLLRHETVDHINKSDFRGQFHMLS